MTNVKTGIVLYCILSVTQICKEWIKSLNPCFLPLIVIHYAKQNRNLYPIKVLYRNIDLLTTNTAYPNTIQHTTIPILLKRSSSFQKVLRIPYMNSRKVQQKSIMEIRKSLSMLMSCVFFTMTKYETR